MKRKIIGFLIITAGFFGICAVLYYMFINGLFPGWMNFWEKEKTEPSTYTTEPKAKKPDNKIPVVNNRSEKKVINFNDENENEIQKEERVKKEFGKDDLMRIASSFAERFGSYSNQSNFSNIEDLKIYMTSEMNSWSDEYILKQRGVVSNSQDYFGITTKAIDSEVVEYDEGLGNAKIKVICRRREAQSTITDSGEVYSQNVIIIMRKEYATWKVDSAFWEERN